MQGKDTTTSPPDGAKERVGEIIHHITDDVKTIASGEVELARTELARTVKVAATEAGIILLGGIVALIGLGLLCLVAVVALASVIPPLWLRLLIMAIVYLAIGGAVVGVFAKRLKKDAVPDMSTPIHEARSTVRDIKHGLSR